MKNSKKTLQRLCINAILIALVVVFDILAVKLPNIKITFGGLPIIICAIIYGPLDGAVVGLCGSFIGQLFTYGLSITTPLWIIPAGARGIVMGLLFIAFKRIKAFPVLTLEIIISSIVVTALNTLATYLDGIIIGYDVRIVFVTTVIRFVIGIITAVIYSALTTVIIRATNHYSSKTTSA